jgi:hypothetical protein
MRSKLPQLATSFISSQPCDVACWHIAPFGCNAELVDRWGIADIDQAASINLDL